MIILAFQGTGKTTYANTHKDAIDLDFKKFDTKSDNWEKAYVDQLIAQDTEYVLGNIAEPVMRELDDRGIPFTVFSPVHGNEMNKTDQDVKALMLGRYVLRKEQNERNVKWLEKIKRHYDEWTAMDSFFFPNCSIEEVTLERNTVDQLIKEISNG